MASDQSFVDYVCEQVAAAGHISQRKMFGEYAVYCDGKVVALVCDNQFFLKPTAASRALLDHVREGFPYPGAKPWIVADEWLDDDTFIARLVRVTAAELPMPKPKARKKVAVKKSRRAVVTRKR
ncbi:MAG: TfoX/Sxy family protein [Steroidobacteraceae bacterium]